MPFYSCIFRMFESSLNVLWYRLEVWRLHRHHSTLSALTVSCMYIIMDSMVRLHGM